ncbi:MAG: type II secretion system secretin GspD [Pseudomonadota bacterium]
MQYPINLAVCKPAMRFICNALPALMLVFGLALTGPVLAQSGDESSGNGHLLNFQDADIRSLITAVADITGRSIVIDPAVSGRVTVISNESLDSDEVFDVFLSILSVHGFSAITEGRVTRIVPDTAARFGANASGASGMAQDPVTRILRMQHVRASEVLPMLRSLVPQSAVLTAHEPSNSLLISDRQSHVDRIEAVIRRLDAATDDALEVITLSHANADEVAEIANQIYVSSEREMAIADLRTNSIVLSGDPGQRLRLRTLISHLDTPMNVASGSRVIYLRYADVELLLPVLESLVAEPDGSVSNVRIQAHAETNALIVSAPPSIERELQSIVDQLDIRRAQVLVEAIIAEVAADTDRELGIQWQFFESGDTGFFGGTNFDQGGNNILNLSAGLAGDGDNLALPGTGLNLGYVGGRTSLLGIDLLEIGALARALATDGDTNILSTPSIVTMDNHPASINVGQEVPFLSGSFATEGISTADGQVNPFQTINREEIGVKLSVTPYINEGDSIMLAIEQEVSTLAPIVGAVDLITNKRTINTRVMVPDGALLVLGGLIQDDLQESVERVPGLSSIPLLGELFTYRSSSQVKRNLMVFIRPQILEDDGLVSDLTASKYSYIRDQQLRTQDKTGLQLVPDEEMPLLPELYDFLQTRPADVEPPTPGG